MTAASAWFDSPRDWSAGIPYEDLTATAVSFQEGRPDAGYHTWTFCLNAFAGARQTSEEAKQAAWEAAERLRAGGPFESFLENEPAESREAARFALTGYPDSHPDGNGGLADEKSYIERMAAAERASIGGGCAVLGGRDISYTGYRYARYLAGNA